MRHPQWEHLRLYVEEALYSKHKTLNCIGLIANQAIPGQVIADAVEALCGEFKYGMLDSRLDRTQLVAALATTIDRILKAPLDGAGKKHITEDHSKEIAAAPESKGMVSLYAQYNGTLEEATYAVIERSMQALKINNGWVNRRTIEDECAGRGDVGKHFNPILATITQRFIDKARAGGASETQALAKAHREYVSMFPRFKFKSMGSYDEAKITDLAVAMSPQAFQDFVAEYQSQQQGWKTRADATRQGRQERRGISF